MSWTLSLAINWEKRISLLLYLICIERRFFLSSCFRRLHYYCISLSSKIRYQLKFQVYIPQVIVLHLQKATFQKTGFSRNVSQDGTSCWEVGRFMQTTKVGVNRSSSSRSLTKDLANICTIKYWMGLWIRLLSIWHLISHNHS